MAKSLLERMGIIVNDEEQNMSPNFNHYEFEQQQDNDSSQNSEGKTIEASTDYSDIVGCAYAKLPATENDITIVEKVLANFSMLPEESKPEVVKKTLEATGYNCERFVVEAQTKKSALANALNECTQKTLDEVGELNALISEAENKINECKQAQLNLKNRLEKAKNDVNEESQRLQNVITLLGGK